MPLPMGVPSQSPAGHRIACRFELYGVRSSSGVLTRRIWYWCGGVALALSGSAAAADECARYIMVLKLERALSAADATSKATTEAFNALGPLSVGEGAKGLDVARKADHAALNARHKAAISAHEVMFVALCGEWTTNP